MKRIPTLVAFVLLPGLALAADDTKETDRVENAGKVITEILNVPEDIPQNLVDKADCVIVLPSVLKAAFVFGGSYGRGVMTCRGGSHFDGPWGPPTMMALEGGSFGLEIGCEATDLVLLLMSERSARGVLTSKVKVGADASAAAGPKGRDAEAATDATIELRFSATPDHEERSLVCRLRAQRCGLTMKQIRSSTVKR